MWTCVRERMCTRVPACASVRLQRGEDTEGLPIKVKGGVAEGLPGAESGRGEGTSRQRKRLSGF